MSEFDKLSLDYQRILDRDIGLSGENAEYFADYKARCIKKSLGDGFRGSILDYGCGIGLVIKHLKRCFDPGQVRITGYDISKESVKKAVEGAEDVLFISDFEKIGSSLFDAIIVANVIHHIKPQVRINFLKKISELLKKNGYIFIFEHNPYNPVTRSVVKKTILDRDASLITLKETGRILNKAGISVFKKRYIVFFPRYLKGLRFLEPVLGMVPIGAQYLCIGKHPAA